MYCILVYSMECDKKEFTERIHRISGQIAAIEKMYLDKRSAKDILQQIVAIRSSLSSLAKVIVESEVRGCLSEDEEMKSVSHLVDTLFKVT